MTLRIMLMLFSAIATTIMGILVTAALSAKYASGRAILAAVAAGILLSIPVSWLIARSISRQMAQ